MIRSAGQELPGRRILTRHVETVPMDHNRLFLQSIGDGDDHGIARAAFNRWTWEKVCLRTSDPSEYTGVGMHRSPLMR